MEMYLKVIIVLLLLTTLVSGDQWYETSITQKKSNTRDKETKDVLKMMRYDGAKENKGQFEIKSNKSILTKKAPNEFENLSYDLPANYHPSVLFRNLNKPNVMNYSNIENVANTSARQQRSLRKLVISGAHEQNIQFIDYKTPKSRFLDVFKVVQFKHVMCTSTSGLEGRCIHEYDCSSSGGSPMGACADGYGVCCVVVFSCYGQTSAAVSWLTNPDFPSPSINRLACTLTVNKSSSDIKQIRLDFERFELMAPTLGACDQDQFVVSGQNTNHVVPILCGVNTGQHIYIQVDESEGPIRLTILTIAEQSRLFAIKITQIKRSDILAAPAGCLQYFNQPQGYIESFNYRNVTDITSVYYPSYLNNLNYAICMKREKSSCSVTYTNEDPMQIVNYDNDGLSIIPPRQAGVEIFNCPSDWLLIAAVRLCGERLNDGSVIHDFYLDAPVTDISAGPIVVWFRSDEGYVGRGFKLHYQQNSCAISV